MEANYNLDKLEKKTASVIYQDGIFDMTLGLALVVYGIALILYDIMPESWTLLIMFIVYAVFVAPLFIIQAFVTKPRLGIVKYTAKRKTKTGIVITIAVALFIANIVVFILITQGVIDFIGNVYLIAAMFGFVPLIVFTVMAYLMDFKRLYLVGFLFSITITSIHIFMIHDLDLVAVIFAVGLGAIIILIGAISLIRFLRKYPKNTGQDYEFKETANQ